MRVATLVAALWLLTTLSLHKLCSNDIWIHLSGGRLIAHTGRIPKVDPFSYGAGLNRPWLDHEWLAQVVFHGMFGGGGVPGLLLGQTGLVLLAAIACTVVAARRVGLGWAAVVPAAIGLMAYPRFLVRPEIVAFLCGSGQLLCLSGLDTIVRAARHRRMQESRSGLRAPAVFVAWLLTVAAVQAAWANAHPSFPVGVGLCVAFAIGAIFRRPTEPARYGPWSEVRWAGAAALATAAACCANPQGVELWLHPFRQLGASAYMQGVGEWKSLFSEDVGGAWRTAFAATAGVGLLGFAVNRESLDVDQLLVFAGAALLPCLSYRHVGLAAFLLAPIAVCQAGRACRSVALPVSTVLALSAAIVACLVLSYAAKGDRFYDAQRCARRWGFGLDAFQYPVKAVDFAEEAGLQGNLFNNYDIGGYLMWRLGPERRVFVDGRNMVYGEEFYKQYRSSLLDWRLWCELAKKHNFEWVVLRHTSVDMDTLVRRLFQDPAWALCCYDHTGVIFVRRDGANAEVAKKHEITLNDTPRQERERPDAAAILSGKPGAERNRTSDLALGGFFRKIELYYRASEHLSRAAQCDPRDPQTLGDLGALYMVLDFRPEAERILQRALLLDPQRFGTRVNLAKLCATGRRFDEAIAHYRVALQQKPNDARLHNNLATIYARKDDLANAVPHFRTALSLAPGYRPPAYNLASILIGQGRHEQAEAVCRRLLAENPNDATAKGLLRRIQQKKQQPPTSKTE